MEGGLGLRVGGGVDVDSKRSEATRSEAKRSEAQRSVARKRFGEGFRGWGWVRGFGLYYGVG